MKFYLMLFSIVLLSCKQNNPATVNSAGEWVPTGDSFSLGQSEDVDLIKGMMADFNNLDLEGVQNRWGGHHYVLSLQHEGAYHYGK